MRLTLPSRIPIYYVGVFAGLLFLMQQVDHTSLFFSACCFLFILVAGLAFNVAGGLTTASGGYVFFYATLAVIIGLVWKAVLGEPAESNLLEPRLTIEVYVGGICALFASVLVSRRFTRKRALLADLKNLNTMRNASTGCLIVGASLLLLAQFVQQRNGTLFSALLQVNRFNELAILLSITYQIRKSGGRSSINLITLLGSLVLFINGGLLSFSKQAMFAPFICWVLAAGAQGYRVSRLQLVSGALVLYFMVQFLVPYSQYGRSQSTGSFSGNVKLSAKLLSDLGSVRTQYQSIERDNAAEALVGYYNTPQGLFDRLQMLFPDSSLMESTERLGPYGLFPILLDFENLIPHFLWPAKPSYQWGNIYAHERLTPGIADEDETTGISFSPTGEAYRLEKWPGVLILAPVIWTLSFIWLDSLCGDVRRSPWGLLLLTLFAHVAPEGMLAGLIYLAGYGAFAIVIAAVSSTYVMPLLGSVLTGPGDRNVLHKTKVRSLPRRVSTAGGTDATGA